jgi:hypothetical protein
MPPGLARRPSGRTAAGCKQAAGLTGNQGPALRSRPACFEGYLRLSGNRFPPKRLAKASASSDLEKQNNTRSLSSRRQGVRSTTVKRLKCELPQSSDRRHLGAWCGGQSGSSLLLSLRAAILRARREFGKGREIRIPAGSLYFCPPAVHNGADLGSGEQLVQIAARTTPTGTPVLY